MAEANVGSTELIPISEHSRVLMAMHTAMRADSQRLIAAAAALPDGDTAAAAALGRAFAAIVGLIHDHHVTEDDVMYPFLLDRVRTFEHDAIRLENDHVELDAAMARINARFRLLAHQLSAALWQDTRSHLLDEAAAFDRVLVDHLDREEDLVIPPFESMISEAEQHTLQKKEATLSTYRHMRLAVPWVLANATPEEEKYLRTTAPRLLGVIQVRPPHGTAIRIGRYLTPWPTATPKNVVPAVLRHLLTTTTIRAGVDLVAVPAPAQAGKNAGDPRRSAKRSPKRCGGRSFRGGCCGEPRVPPGSDSVQR
jgi:hemerythrin-like domain-containing protein